jgi:hypothetical protein
MLQNESTPLLRDGLAVLENIDESASVLEHDQGSIKSKSSRGGIKNDWQTVLWLAVIILLLDAGAYIAVAPEIAIVEQIVCKRYPFSIDGGIDDKCKIEPIQSEVAFLLGWKESLCLLPGWSAEFSRAF